MEPKKTIIALSASEVDEAITSLEALGYYRLDDDEREESLYDENGLMPKENELLEKLSAAYQAHKNQGGSN